MSCAAELRKYTGHQRRGQQSNENRKREKLDIEKEEEQKQGSVWNYGIRRDKQKANQSRKGQDNRKTMHRKGRK